MRCENENTTVTALAAQASRSVTVLFLLLFSRCRKQNQNSRCSLDERAASWPVEALVLLPLVSFTKTQSSSSFIPSPREANLPTPPDADRAATGPIPATCCCSRRAELLPAWPHAPSPPYHGPAPLLLKPATNLPTNLPIPFRRRLCQPPLLQRRPHDPTTPAGDFPPLCKSLRNRDRHPRACPSPATQAEGEWRALLLLVHDAGLSHA